MTQRYITFANYKRDLPLLNSLYSEVSGSRITLRLLREAGSDLPKTKLWVDAEIDGLHFPEVFKAPEKGYKKYNKYIQQFRNARQLVESHDTRTVSDFVKSVLDSIMEAASGLTNLGWVSVPQLPYIPGGSRNRVNRLMAESSLKWRALQSRPPRLILPVIFAKQRGQTDSKTTRSEKVKLAYTCYEASGADGLWVVDSELDDHADNKVLENHRFPGIIHFHEELNSALPSDAVSIAGPYWGLNLVLWTRRLVRFPAVPIGSTYRYAIPGRDPKSRAAGIRVAVPPLKRLVNEAALRPWLQDALRKLDKADPTYPDLSLLAKRMPVTNQRAREDVASFYRDWLTRIESTPTVGRALTLYQDFSAAFVLGNRLKQFDKTMEDVPDPAIIAKQLMVNCL